MATSLKTFFSTSLVRRLAADVVRVHPRFPERRFVKQACSGLDALELLDRGKHIARVLGEYLPQTYPDAISVLLRSLGPEHVTDELVGAGMAPFFYLPHVLFVAERGLEHFDLSMRALAHQVRNRQAAALYLQAATMTDTAVARERLRRRAARLISPDLGDRGLPLAC